MHVRCKVGKNIIFQNNTLPALVCSRDIIKHFGTNLFNFKHFLKAENSEDSLASSCEKWLSGNPVWDWVTIGTIIQAEIPFKNNTHELSGLCLSAGRSQSRTTQNEQVIQHRRLLPSPRRCCSNCGPVRDVLARCTSRLDYPLFVKGICLD